MRSWDVETGKELGRFEETKTQVFGAALSPDGRFVLSGHHDGAMRCGVWRADACFAAIRCPTDGWWRRPSRRTAGTAFPPPTTTRSDCGTSKLGDKSASSRDTRIMRKRSPFRRSAGASCPAAGTRPCGCRTWRRSGTVQAGGPYPSGRKCGFFAGRPFRRFGELGRHGAAVAPARTDADGSRRNQAKPGRTRPRLGRPQRAGGRQARRRRRIRTIYTQFDSVVRLEARGVRSRAGRRSRGDERPAGEVHARGRRPANRPGPMGPAAELAPDPARTQAAEEGLRACWRVRPTPRRIGINWPGRRRRLLATVSWDAAKRGSGPLAEAAPVALDRLRKRTFRKRRSRRRETATPSRRRPASSPSWATTV